MIRFLLDTNICIYAIKKKSKGLVNRLRSTKAGEVGVSSITLSELEYGIAKSSQPIRSGIALIEFLGPFEILPYGNSAAKEYGRIRMELERSGSPIGPLDTLIAAHALSLDCSLVTNNEREFRRVPSLRAENWTEGG